jgi:phosphomannomutase
MDIDQSIFKAYDIRGIYPSQLNETGAYAIAKGYATLIQNENPGKQLTIAVGADMRTSSPSIKAEVIRGLTESGVNVADIGLVSTPTYYFAVGYYKYDGGIQISASHNPKEYNGLKMVRAGGIAMSGETGIKDLAKIAADETFVAAEEPGTVEVIPNVTEQAIGEYLKLAGNPTIKPFKIVIDVANAMGSPDYEALFQKIPGEIIKMNFELDGTFPAHEADPLKDENTKELRERVVAEQANLGIAADGDSDRVFIIDEKGQTIPSPILYTLLADILLKDHPADTFAYELRMGRLVESEFADKPAKLVQTPVGHSLIKKVMLDNNALFGGEISGHYFFRMPFGTFEAPTFLVIQLLHFLSQQDQPLSALVDQYRRFVSSGEVNTKMDSRELIEQKIELIKNKYSDGKQIFIDGIKVDYPDYWFSIRASNTEPVIRLIVEAADEAIMSAKRDELLTLIRN